MYIIQEIQTTAGTPALLTPIVKATKAEAESEYYIKLGYAAISQVELHTVMLYTAGGELIMSGHYEHGGTA